MPETVIVIANGDLRLSANQKCWPAQALAEEAVMHAIRGEGMQSAAAIPAIPKRATALSTARNSDGGVPDDSGTRRRWWWWRPCGSTAIMCCPDCIRTADRS